MKLRLFLAAITIGLFIPSVNATTYAVKAGGGGNFTTIQACATAMAAGDTCTVYAGTYNEIVTVPAGTMGNYKTPTPERTGLVEMLAFTAPCPTKQIRINIFYSSPPADLRRL